VFVKFIHFLCVVIVYLFSSLFNTSFYRYTTIHSAINGHLRSFQFVVITNVSIKFLCIFLLRVYLVELHMYIT
jgi:hypothetical protein